jgi:hypothetical protein
MTKANIRCERCGLIVAAPLVKFHVCQGKNPNLRPANTPLNVWATKTGSSQPSVPVPPIPKIAKDTIILELRDQLNKMEKEKNSLEKEKSSLSEKLRSTKNIRDYFIFGSFCLIMVLVSVFTKHC